MTSLPPKNRAKALPVAAGFTTIFAVITAISLPKEAEIMYGPREKAIKDEVAAMDQSVFARRDLERLERNISFLNSAKPEDCHQVSMVSHEPSRLLRDYLAANKLVFAAGNYGSLARQNDEHAMQILHDRVQRQLSDVAETCRNRVREPS